MCARTYSRASTPTLAGPTSTRRGRQTGEGQTRARERPAFFGRRRGGGKAGPRAAFSPQTRLLYIPANENLCHELTGEVPKYVVGERYMGVAKNVMKMVADA